MKYLRNEKGVALVMVLVLSLIALAIVSAMLFMITQGTQMSGSLRFVRTAEEASTGGTEVSTEFIGNNVANALNGLSFVTVGSYALRSGGSQSSDACLRQKMTLTKSAWASCGANDLLTDPTINPDLTFPLGDFTAFGKIVDSVEGNSDPGGMVSGELEGTGVVAAESGAVSPPHSPYLYKLEVQAQGTTNVRERSRMSVLYAY